MIRRLAPGVLFIFLKPLRVAPKKVGDGFWMRDGAPFPLECQRRGAGIQKGACRVFKGLVTLRDCD